MANPPATPVGCSTFDAEEEEDAKFFTAIATFMADADTITALTSAEKERMLKATIDAFAAKAATKAK